MTHSVLTEASVSTITVGARSSPLSKAQVIEVQREINRYYPNLTFDCCYVPTTGDKDQKTSLRTMEKTDFFTKEVDALLLSHDCRIAIHSAKDLPQSIPDGLTLIAITKGVDPCDVIVLKPGATLATLPLHPKIATSSLRREEAVKALIPHATFTDVRGTIEKRLSLLNGVVDGVVIAEAALIRLGLTHHNRVKLPGEPAEFQGQLAILARSDDLTMHTLFACIDSR